MSAERGLGLKFCDLHNLADEAHLMFHDMKGLEKESLERDLTLNGMMITSVNTRYEQVQNSPKALLIDSICLY